MESTSGQRPIQDTKIDGVQEFSSLCTDEETKQMTNSVERDFESIWYQVGISSWERRRETGCSYTKVNGQTMFRRWKNHSQTKSIITLRIML